MKSDRKKPMTASKKRFIAWIAGICAVALIAEGVLLAGVFMKKNKKTPKNDVTVTPEAGTPAPTETVLSPTPEPEPEDPVVTIFKETKQYDDDNLQYDITYDAHGNMTQIIIYDSEGKVVGDNRYEYDEEDRLLKSYSKDTKTGEIELTGTRVYDENGDLIKSSTMRYNAGDRIDSRQEFSYDGAHHQIKAVYFDGDTDYVSYIELTEYNQDGKPETLSWTTGAGYVTSRMLFSYDEFGNKDSEVTKDADGNTTAYTVYHYDNGNRKTLEATYEMKGPESRLLLARKYEYSADGLLIRMKTIYSDEKSVDGDDYDYLYEYSYDSRRRVVREKQFYGDSLLADIEHQYDEDDNVIKDIHHNRDGSVSGTIRYEYAPYEKRLSRLTEDELDNYKKKQQYLPKN